MSDVRPMPAVRVATSGELLAVNQVTNPAGRRTNGIALVESWPVEDPGFEHPQINAYRIAQSDADVTFVGEVAHIESGVFRLNERDGGGYPLHDAEEVEFSVMARVTPGWSSGLIGLIVDWLDADGSQIGQDKVEHDLHRITLSPVSRSGLFARPAGATQFRVSIEEPQAVAIEVSHPGVRLIGVDFDEVDPDLSYGPDPSGTTRMGTFGTAPVGWSTSEGAVAYYSRSRDAVAIRILDSSGWATLTGFANPGTTSGPSTYLTEIVDSTAEATLNIGAQGGGVLAGGEATIGAGGGQLRWVREFGFNTGANIRPLRFPTVEDAAAAIGETFYIRAMAVDDDYDGHYFDGSTPNEDGQLYGWVADQDASFSTHRFADEREVLSVEISRQMPSLSPAHMGAAGGMLAATAEVTMAEQQDVTVGRKASPWSRQGGFPPRRGDSISIRVGDENRFSGVVDDVDGSAHGNVSVSSSEGAINEYLKQVSFDPLTSPRLNVNETGTNRPLHQPWASATLTPGDAGEMAVSRLGSGAQLHFGGLLGSAEHGFFWACTSIEPTSLMDLLMDAAAARNAALWFNRDSQLIFMDPDVLEAQDPTTTITADADILDVSWSEKQTYEHVEVTGQQFEQVYDLRATITVVDGRMHTLEEAGDEVVEIITPAQNEEWVTLDTHNLGSVSAYSNPHAQHWLKGQGTFLRLVVIDPEDDDTPESSFPGNTALVLRRITSQAYEMRFSLTEAHANQIPSGHIVQSRWRSYNRTAFSREPTPVVRAYHKLIWEDYKHTGEMAGNPNMPTLTHDVGRWLGDRPGRALADHLAARLTQQRITLDDIPIVWRDDLDLGQVITLTEDQVYDITLTCLVIGLRERHTPEQGAQMWVTLRVLDGEGLDHLYSFGEAAFGAGPYGGNRP